ncbi:HotDog domain-containing protein [Aspergillus aurantiobrunneus]
MIGARQVVHPRLRYAAAQLHPIPRSPPLAPRNITTVTYRRSPERSPWLRRLIYFGTFGVLGVAVGKWATDPLNPPHLPGDEGDEEVMEYIRQAFSLETIVEQLREDPDYTEAHVYGNYSGEDKEQRLTSGPLRGGGGLALQKVFWNNKEKKAVNVVWLGKGIEGWPMVVHGGAIATIIDEHLARVAIQHLPERTAVTANLDINYRNMAWSHSFYYVHATLDQERSTDRKAYVKGEVRDGKGNVCAEASGLFVVPRGYKLRSLGETY